jgi:hypothetical protein
MTGTITTRYDRSTGVIHVDSTGVWDIEYFHTFATKQESLINQCQADHGIARVLSDTRIAGVVTREMADLISEFTARCYKPEDRIAIIVESSLLKLQMRRVFSPCRVEVFTSSEAAETWLFERDPELQTP